VIDNHDWISATPSPVSGGGDLTVQVDANDTGPVRSAILLIGNSGTGQSVAVLQYGDTIAQAGDDQTVDVGAYVYLNGTGSTSYDGDDTTLGYRWEQVSGWPVRLLQPSNNEECTTPCAKPGVVFLAPATPGDSYLVFRLTVTDTNRDTATDEVTVKVLGQVLTDHRDRVLVGWAADQGESNVCDAYMDLATTAREVFIWNTHRLHLSDMMGGVTKLHAVVGANDDTVIHLPFPRSPQDRCGGGEHNRTYMVMNLDLLNRFRILRDVTTCNRLTKWRQSHDPAGAHAPFASSIETCFAEPRGQIHFLVDPNKSNVRGPKDEIAIDDEYIFEMDQDNGVLHHSSTRCGGIKSKYSRKYGSPYWGWSPSACRAARQAGGPFTHTSIDVGVTPARGIYIEELRARIDGLRISSDLGAFAWTDPTIEYGITPVKAVHLAELRTALDAVYAAEGRDVPTYTDSTVVAGTTPLKAVHVSELRVAIVAAERQSSASETGNDGGQE
jgi:hypothetical protein